LENVYIIAELSANHNNDYDLAVRTIQAMADAGADAVKVQTYRADSLALDIENEYFGPKTSGLWKGRRPYELYQEASMPYEWQPELQRIAEELGMEFFSSPFDLAAVDFLECLDVPRYKIASFEITDIPLIRYAARTGKPMIMSTGIATEEDIQRAIDACRAEGNEDITILKCTSNYPAELKDANLRTIPDMIKRFGVKVGLSDHTPGHLVPTVAVALGACVVEKHFILDRKLGGPDAAFSLEPQEFKAMVDAVRATEATLGAVTYAIKPGQELRRRSLFAVQDIAAGESFTLDNVRSLRPGHGLHPRFFPDILGKPAQRAYQRGEPISVEEAGTV
jgi:pseudaminic acid synthase